jgi:ribonuclease P protein component
LEKKRPFGLPKSEKLKSKKRFEHLFAQGKTISSFPLKLIFAKADLPKNVNVQVGVSVPKRIFKSAVKRNRIKRLVREAYRLNKQDLFNNSEGNYAFLFLYLGTEMPTYAGIVKNMLALLQKFINTVNDDKKI